jgi:hypothetical protein
VAGEAELGGERVHLGVVITLVEAEALRRVGCRVGPRDRDRLDRGTAELEVVQVRARWRDPERDALTLAEEAPFRPFLLGQWDSGGCPTFCVSGQSVFEVDFE